MCAANGWDGSYDAHSNEDSVTDYVGLQTKNGVIGAGRTLASNGINFVNVVL